MVDRVTELEAQLAEAKEEIERREDLLNHIWLHATMEYAYRKMTREQERSMAILQHGGEER